MSMLDFRDLCQRIHIHIVKEIPIIHGQAASGAWGANVRADSALYVLEKQ
jgi:hypothetical protein